MCLKILLKASQTRLHWLQPNKLLLKQTSPNIIQCFCMVVLGLAKHTNACYWQQTSPGKAKCKICYVHSERFVSDMVKALQLGAINEFKKFYRNLNALLIDDIQFLLAKNNHKKSFFTLQ
ncbi:MAG: hypothetical protein CM15mP22_5650 [Gammaproteobacteria bacterium]|nr:MAG: hypothetical protein CM15mP22_5650 [Gammaproteobacteria bacterium]